MKKIEYAIQVRCKGRFFDIETFNEWNCRWDYPIENWFERIRDGWIFDRIRRRFKSARIVKRTTTEEVLFKGSEVQNAK